MNSTIIKRLGNLLSVKSLVTLTLTAVFAYMAVAGTISQDFMTVYAVVIAFYFGTQSQKAQVQTKELEAIANELGEAAVRETLARIEKGASNGNG